MVELEARLVAAEEQIKLLSRLMPECRAWKWRQDWREKKRIKHSPFTKEEEPALKRLGI